MPIQRPLTPRQHVILRNVARGKTNKDIAAELGISEQGVKVHISRLLERYGAENRVELVNLARAWPEADGNRYAELSGGAPALLAARDNRPVSVITKADLLEFVAHQRKPAPR